MICLTTLSSAQIYGAETWTVTSKIGKMLMIWERKILRKIYGPTKENGQWRLKTNAELITKYKSQDIVTVIKIRRLEWLGHVIRMNETRSVKKIFEGKLEGRGRGRPRLRWINNLTLRLLMSYIYGAPSKARNSNVVYIWTYVWQR